MTSVNCQVRKIVIVGRDMEAWITAFFLKAALDKRGNDYNVSLVDLGTQLTVDDVYAVLPAYRMLHKTLGANEGKLGKTARARIFYGQRFAGWNPGVAEFFHAYDRHGINFKGIDFYQYWIKARMNGLNVPLEEFSLGVAAAKHRRRVSSTDETGFSHAAYGYHLSAREYSAAIAQAAINAGVERVSGDLKQINRDNENIVSLELQDGSVIEADFYIDASGPEARLISTLSEDNFESWEHWFRCDRMISASCGVLSPSPAFSQVTALSSGWCGMYPLDNRTAVQALYSSQDANFSQVVEEVETSLGADIRDGIDRQIRCGMLKRPWIGNCLSVGSSAATLEPLDASQQHPLVISMIMLRQLFPNSDEYRNERMVYNKKMYSFISNLRNFQLSHYQLSSRSEPFWMACREVEPPSVLAEKIALFKASGFLSVREDETFQEENWLSIFNGHGLNPASYSPLVDNMTDDELIRNLQKILGAIRTRIESFPLIGCGDDAVVV